MQFRRRISILSNPRRTISDAAALLTVASITLSAVVYLGDIPKRELNTIYTAWQIVANMDGKSASGGREHAIAQLRSHKEDLSGITLDNSFLSRIDLSNARLRAPTFVNADHSYSIFNHSILSHASFRGARLHEAQFINAQIDSSDFTSAIIKDGNFNTARTFRCVGDSLTLFGGSTFNNAHITYSQFPGSNFNNADFLKSYLISIVLSNCLMRRSDVRGSHWRHVEAHNLDLSLAEANGVHVSGWSDLSGSRFDGTCLQFARFEQVILSNASFFNSNLLEATFIGSDLSGVDFSSSNLQDVTIDSCIINGTIFSGANQPGLQLIDCIGEPLGLAIGKKNELKYRDCVEELQ